TQELIIALYAFISIYSVCLCLTQGSQLVYRYIASEKCDAPKFQFWCIFRYIATVLTLSFAPVHVGITVQHGLSSFLFSERIQQFVARLSILVSGLSPIIFGILAYYQDSLDGQIAYCSGFTANSEGVLMFMLYLVLVLDILNSLASLLSGNSTNAVISTRQSYDLARTFHRRQNLYAMHQFLPIATLHAILYAHFFLTVYFSQLLKSRMTPGWYTFVAAVANIIPHYYFLCPLMFLFLIRRGRFRRVSHINSMVNAEKNPND
ncbi:hypothetical protein PENTCL1PPCAC_16402, partial [Pristionchus entomophagus]